MSTIPYDIMAATGMPTISLNTPRRAFRHRASLGLIPNTDKTVIHHDDSYDDSLMAPSDSVRRIGHPECITICSFRDS